MLGDKATKKEICAELGLKKAIDIRSYCFAQIRNKTAWEMYALKNKKAIKTTEDDGDPDDD